MNNRRLSLLVLVVVAAVALSVHWYLAAETAAAPLRYDDHEVILESSADVTAATVLHGARTARVAGAVDAQVSDS